MWGAGGAPGLWIPLVTAPRAALGARGGQLLQPLPAVLPPTPSSVQRVSTSSLPWHFQIVPGDLGCHCPNCCSSLTLLLWCRHPSFLLREYSAPVAGSFPPSTAVSLLPTSPAPVPVLRALPHTRLLMSLVASIPCIYVSLTPQPCPPAPTLPHSHAHQPSTFLPRCYANSSHLILKT